MRSVSISLPLSSNTHTHTHTHIHILGMHVAENFLRQLRSTTRRATVLESHHHQMDSSCSLTVAVVHLPALSTACTYYHVSRVCPTSHPYSSGLPPPPFSSLGRLAHDCRSSTRDSQRCEAKEAPPTCQLTSSRLRLSAMIVDQSRLPDASKLLDRPEPLSRLQLGPLQARPDGVTILRWYGWCCEGSLPVSSAIAGCLSTRATRGEARVSRRIYIWAERRRSVALRAACATCDVCDACARVVCFIRR
ncbi:hypothetical protein GGS23DRAFT_8717 [Durotheca rogersii]|uniref:uncharacterized protein n=1 Tax=Durotheca rogersii TaxID=419775 RepID=UPI00221FDB18|nr:uncharacterized protein GGS23DRAFT_8717 [Durotheca rogersii]KAI5868044.1 hypothetical protein GGS23DRAFT_8717 [Durotheca rogersii]